jgi:hypothetical protein
MPSTAIARGRLTNREGVVVRIAPWHEAPKPLPDALMPEERWHIIALAARSLAKERGFIGGSPVQDWLAARTLVGL